jgi:XTP/dITP diphosphohydrolase
MMEEKLKAFERLLNIMDELRAKCPWDMKQTMESLRYLTIEETYELSEAIVEGDLEEIRKELGDVMLHLVFYAKIGEEKNAFGMAEVLMAIKGLSFRWLCLWIAFAINSLPEPDSPFNKTVALD